MQALVGAHLQLRQLVGSKAFDIKEDILSDTGSEIPLGIVLLLELFEHIQRFLNAPHSPVGMV